MKRRILLGIFAWACLCGPSGRSQDDFLTSQEIDAIRDAQEPAKRILAYVEFAQRRLNAIKERLASQKAGAGREAQKNLKEYISILEALEGTIADARAERASFEKALKEAETRLGEFQKYLESLQPPSSPYWSDYHYTLEEAVDMTREGLANAKKGTFPEVEEREPPRLPPTPPPPSSPKGGEEGPPRKRR